MQVEAKFEATIFPEKNKIKFLKKKDNNVIT